jgi:hypothetical protein
VAVGVAGVLGEGMVEGKAEGGGGQEAATVVVVAEEAKGEKEVAAAVVVVVVVDIRSICHLQLFKHPLQLSHL